ncbi:MAG: hypothetical protein ACYDBV_15095, partial [Nitrospiria bacterium]
QNQSSTYVYFENALGMNFKTIEGMFAQGPIKSFVHVDTAGFSIFNLNDNNIISYEPVQIASSLDRIGYGGLNQQISTYNIRTRSYQTSNVQMPQGNYGSPGRYNSSSFMQQFGQTYGRFSFIPVDTASRPFTSIDTMTPYQLAYVSNLMQNQINVQVFGDPIVKAGDVVNLNIPQSVNVSGFVNSDPQIAGNYVVSQLCRNIGMATDKPRYTESLECVSGSLPTGV